MSSDGSSWSIRHPVPTLVLFLVLTLGGIVSFFQLGIDANPNVDLPIVAIETQYAGAGAQELEAQFTKKVEDAVAGLGNVDEIYSAVSDGESYTAVRFALGADTQQMMDEVRDAIARIRQDLVPYAEFMTIQKLRYDNGAILTYALRSKTQSVEALSDLVDHTIGPALMAVKGVADVERQGGVDREIRVDLNPRQLIAYGVSAIQVNEQINEFNRNLPGGRSQVSGQEQSVRALGKLQGATASLAALQALEIVLPTGETVPLQTLATVADDFGEVRQAATFNNQPVVSFGVYRSNGSLLVDVEEGVRDALFNLKETLPKDVELQLIFTRATDVREAYRASLEALIIGCVLAVVVVGFFLRNWRTTFITATALPLSAIPTFMVLKGLGYSLNSMTLLALTLAIGNLVDDSIVEVENVERHMAMGKPPVRAAMDSAEEVGLAVMTATATVVCVFVPVAFMGGIPGQFFQPFGVTVAVATLFSTLVARFVTPLMAARLLRSASPMAMQQVAAEEKIRSATDSGNARRSGYEQLLRAALRHRLVSVAIAIAIFLASLTLIPHIPTGLFGTGNTDLSNLSIELPPGNTFERTQATLQDLSDRLLAHPDVENIYVSQGVSDAEVVIRLKPRSERQSRQSFEQAARSLLLSFPDIRFSFDNQGPGNSDKALSIVLKSENSETLTQTANELAQQMRQLPGLVEVSTSTGLVKPELLIIPNPQKAADLGVNLRDIATTATLATLGDTDSNLAEIDTGDRQIPIRVRLAPEFRADLAALENIQIASTREQLVPLSSVANITFGGGIADIERFDRARQITVAANLEGITLGQGLEAVYELPVLASLPAGVSQQASGDADILQDVFSRFTIALGIAIVMIYAVLVLLYNNFLYPFVVMSALPLSIGGTFIALLLTHKPLDLYALIGIVLLMGLVTKNSILLVDYALLMRQRGLSLYQAVIESGTTRLRPILMTSISTVAGMLPTALELGPGGEVQSSMAIAVIGGFSTSTLLTLVVVPVCFTYVAGLQHRLGYVSRWFGSLLNRSTGRSTGRLAYASSHPILSEKPSEEFSENFSENPYKHSPLKSALAVYPPPVMKSTPSSTSQTANTAAGMAESFQRNLDTSTSHQPAQSIVLLDSQPPMLQQPESIQDTYTIACIESDFKTICTLHEYLDDTVFSIISVDDPAIALTELTQRRPDIILMTLSMTGLNGFEVCDRLRRNPIFRSVPIILLTSKLTWYTRLKARWYGASACLNKPLDRTQLLIKLFLMLI